MEELRAIGDPIGFEQSNSRNIEPCSSNEAKLRYIWQNLTTLKRLFSYNRFVPNCSKGTA